MDAPGRVPSPVLVGPTPTATALKAGTDHLELRRSGTGSPPSVNGGVTTTYGWCARGTLNRSRSAAGRPCTPFFDAFGRPVTDGTSTYTYDGLDRMRTRRRGHHDLVGLTQELVRRRHLPVLRRTPAAPPWPRRPVTYSRILVANAHGDIIGTTAPAAYGPEHLDGVRPLGQGAGTTGGTQPSRGYQGDWTDPNTTG